MARETHTVTVQLTKASDGEQRLAGVLFVWAEETFIASVGDLVREQSVAEGASVHGDVGGTGGLTQRGIRPFDNLCDGKCCLIRRSTWSRCSLRGIVSCRVRGGCG